MSYSRSIPILLALVAAPALAQDPESPAAPETVTPEAVPQAGTPAPWPGYGMPMPFPPPPYFGHGMPVAPEMPAQPFADGSAGGTGPTQSAEGQALPAPRSSYPPAYARAAPSMGMRLSREVTEAGYVLRITVGEGQTQGVQVSPLSGPRGQGLAIANTSEAQVMQEDTLADGRGYQRSFSFSRGSMNRRIPVPPDADLTKMSREDLTDTVVITIPRRAPEKPSQN
jgi:hypothetical protein